jgi:methyl-accepting chemotaxis protein
MTMRVKDLSLNHKLRVLALLGLLLGGVPTGLYVADAVREQAEARRAAAGAAPIREALKTAQLVQRHRGLSSLVLGGVKELPEREATQKALDASIRSLDTQLAAAGLDDAVLAAWRKAGQDWTDLAAKVGSRSLPVDESVARHTGVVRELTRFIDDLADRYGLWLERDAARRHLSAAALESLPALIEDIGQAQARGAQYLVKGRTSSELRIALGVGTQRIEDGNEDSSLRLAKAFRASPALREGLEAGAGKLAARVRETLALTRRVLDADTIEVSSGEYFAAYTAVIDEAYALNAVALDRLVGSLEARAADLAASQALLLGLMAAMFALAGWLGYLVARSVTGPAAAALRLANALADGDLTQRVDADSADEMGRLLAALARMRDSLARSVSDIRNAADSVHAGAREIARGNSDLSSRTEEQASSLEETASSMEELASTVRNNSDRTLHVSELASGASQVAQRSGAAVRDVVATMNGISESSKKVADIVGIIDSIAFQTNILALNAAVEAARAGEQGRGFAVVASEVRALAQRSAGAARDIKALIDGSVGRIDAGVRLVDGAGKTIEETVAAVQRMTDLMSEISAAQREQLSGIEQVAGAVAQMDHVVQQNAALVEESAAAADNMEGQARVLVRAVAQFALDEAEQPGKVLAAPDETPRRIAPRPRIARK